MVRYRNFNLKLKNSRKNVENLVKLHFRLFCLCLHGNGQHVNGCLCICFVTIACYIYDTRYKIQETLFNVGYSKTVNISYQLFSDKHEYKNNSK